MNVAFRCDSSNAIGTGHVMRCLTLADQLSLQGHDITFIARHMLPSLKGLIENKGYGFLPLSHEENGEFNVSSQYSSWLGTSETQDALQSLMAIKALSLDWIIMDHYALGQTWTELISESCRNLLIIDDLQRSFSLHHIVIDPSAPPPQLGTIKNRYYGPQYALVRPEFRALRAEQAVRTELRRLLVFMGGVDTYNFSARMTAGLNSWSRRHELDLITIVVGASYRYQKELRDLTAEEPVRIVVQTTEMAQIMSKSDAILCTASSVNWERCTLGLPAVLVCSADNQRVIAHQSYLANSAVCGNDELSGPDLDGRLSRAMDCVFDNVTEMSGCAFDVCDGRGVERVMSIMESHV